jgi:hypothetical protein
VVIRPVLVTRRWGTWPVGHVRRPGTPLITCCGAAWPGVTGAGTGFGDLVRQLISRRAPQVAAYRRWPGRCRPRRGFWLAVSVGSKFLANPVPEVIVR